MGDRISAEGRLAEEIAMDHRARLAQRRTAVLEADPGKILAEKLVAVGGQTFVAGRASRAAVEAQHHMITGREIGDLGTDGLDDARAFVSEHDRDRKSTRLNSSH